YSIFHKMKKNKTICIIDDEEINQFILSTIIKNLNSEIKILSFNNGEVALNSLTQSLVSKEDIPDIILLDINMPVMGGWQFMDEFVKLQIGKKTAIYIITSSSSPDDKKKAKTYSDISDFLTRPIATNTLKEIIEKNE
ncbi:MAG: response regulator, partial [Bacteroidota bacterium]|nr:response regulator [Bacteroidota bacterium]